MLFLFISFRLTLPPETKKLGVKITFQNVIWEKA